MEHINTKLMSAKEIVAEYNSKSGKKPITKFENRFIAEQRLNELRAAIDKKAVQIPKGGHKPDLTVIDDPLAKPATKPVSSDSRSEAIAKTWKVKDVADKRAKRDAVSVVVGGQVKIFKSVSAAFKELRLPIEKHIKFRMELKAAKKAEFQGYKFGVVEQGELAV